MVTQNKILLLASFFVVGLDLFFLHNQESALRIFPSAFLLFFLGFYYKIHPSEYGFTWKIEPSCSYWIKALLVIAAIMGGFCVGAFAVFKIAGMPLPQYTLFQNDVQFVHWMIFACFVSPVVEETIYRCVLCIAARDLLGNKASIFLSGSLFALLHYFYGNPGFDNFIAGYLLAWSFLKSKSVLLPLLLHSAGNAFVGLLHYSIMNGWL